MLVLPVALAMVTNNPVGVGGGVGFGLGRVNLSVQIVVQSLEETLAQIHIANRVDSLGELDGARHLAVSVEPVVLNALHVPLVHKYDDLLSGFRRMIYLLEQLIVSFVDHNFLDLREENSSGLNEPVKLVLIKALLCESSGSNQSDLSTV